MQLLPTYTLILSQDESGLAHTIVLYAKRVEKYTAL